MFELGSSLREARVRRGLDLEEVAERTMIRARFLAALEEERFHVLPHGSYRRSFLREYAEFLGLDGDVYVDEYIARHEPDEPAARLVPPRSRARLRVPAVVNVVLVVAVGCAFGAAVWGLGGSEPKRTKLEPPQAAPPAPPRPGAGALRPPSKGQARAAATRSEPPRAVTFAATRGRCWISVHLGSRDGPVVFERTLEQGHTVRLGLRKPLWIRLGAAENLDASIGGRPVTNLPTSVANVVVSASGLVSD